MALKGFFVITDISGYTEYLTRSELDHANEILQSLFDAQNTLRQEDTFLR